MVNKNAYIQIVLSFVLVMRGKYLSSSTVYDRKVFQSLW